MKHFAAGILAYAVMTGVAFAQSAAAPPAGALQTRPERTGFNETSHYDDVVAFIEAAAKGAPNLIRVTTFGKTSEGRSLPLAVVGAPEATPEAVRRTGKLRVGGDLDVTSSVSVAYG